MKRVTKGFLVILMVTVFVIMAHPTISKAVTYKVLKELELSTGVYKGSISTQRSARGEVLSGFKGVSISIQNGKEDSKYRVAAASVFLDDKKLFSESDFNAHRISLTETRMYPKDPLELKLEVRVRSVWKSTLKVLVTGIYEEDLPVYVRYYLDRDGDGIGGFNSRLSKVPLYSPWVLTTGDRNDMDPNIQ